jgi:hypothetical protein
LRQQYVISWKKRKMKDMAIGVFLFLIGTVMVIFHKPMARSIIEQQNAVWGFRFGKREIKGSEFITLVAGLATAIIGLLSFFQIIHFR